jgi:hypothetical protein
VTRGGALYAPDAVLESPLVPHLLDGDDGVLHGRKELTPNSPSVNRRFAASTAPAI